ncbi:MAG TPA: universal stress protein [Pseudomonadaceae bacterium]|nr:universal stress protein [Pseudomonadaceae bacterium]
MAGPTFFVILDPTQENQPAWVRAIDIVSQTGAHLHVFCCDYVEDDDLVNFKSRSDAKRQTLKKAKAFVEALIAPQKKKGLSISTEVIWNAGWYQAASHASARVAADMIIKSSYSHKGRQHPLHERSDFYLIRNSTCPVLLTKSGERLKIKSVLAAVTLEKGKKDHVQLNNRIVAAAQRVSRSARADLQLVAALTDEPNIIRLLELHIDEDQGVQTEQELIASRYGVEAKKVHVRKGQATTVITRAVRDSGAQVLVLGTKARKGLKGALLGNTAEKVLDKLEIDILVVN